MPQSAYVHIPFCKKKCSYCSFISFEDLEIKEAYIEKLLFEIKHYYEGESLKTLYFGGGTPTVLSAENFKRVIDCFNFSENAEITVEANPESASSALLKDLKKLGVNRLSLGIQTFNDKILKICGRLHNSKIAIKAFENARDAGFENISLDFIYGLPGQTIDDFEKTLKTAADLQPEHISLYGLKIERGTKFAKKKPANLADQDLQADMAYMAMKMLESYGFMRYEFSNFAQPGYESEHNMNYWKNKEYYGFGIAAHGYVKQRRYANYKTAASYFKNPLKKSSCRKLSETERLQEEIFLGFRIKSGIDKEKINEKYCIDFDKKFSKVLKKYLDTGHLQKTEKGYRLSDEGVLLSSSILCEFL